MSATAGREHKRSDGKLPVMEIFGPTVQGEGQLCGTISHFVRFGGCDYRCSWCDSMHAVDPIRVHENAMWLSPADIFKKLNSLGKAPVVTLSGGNPALWDLGELIDLLTPKFYVAIETQGSIWQDWMYKVDLLTVSPKGPSSGMFDQIDWTLLEKFNSLDEQETEAGEVIFKIVVFNAPDFEFAQQFRQRFPDAVIYLSAGTPLQPSTNSDDLIDSVLTSYRNLCEAVLQSPEMSDTVVLPQVHQLLWPGQIGK